MSYKIYTKLASKKGYHTPAEARAYYGRYDRHGITWHWWGEPSLNPDSIHDRIVDYIYNKSVAGTGSVNYVLSNSKITMMVQPDDVAWASQRGNPVSVSVELSPHLNTEGYKRAGWLAADLAKRYNGDRKYYPHNVWFPTECPGTISLDRIRQEEDKWQRGAYDTTPAPVPTDAYVTFAKITPKTFVCNKTTTKLYRVNKSSWGDITVVKTFKKGEKIDIYGTVKNPTLKGEWYITKYSYENKIPTGFSKADLDPYVAPKPITPPADPVPLPIETPKPEWEENLRDIDDTTYWLKRDVKLTDIRTGKPAIVNGEEVTLKKDGEYVASATTYFGTDEYRITDYSFKKGIFNGVHINDLTLTPPGEPDLDPIAENPDYIKKTVVIEFLLSLVKLITDFLTKIK